MRIALTRGFGRMSAGFVSESVPNLWRLFFFHCWLVRGFEYRSVVVMAGRHTAAGHLFVAVIEFDKARQFSTVWQRKIKRQLLDLYIYRLQGKYCLIIVRPTDDLLYLTGTS